MKQEKLGEIISKKRKNLGYTQAALAKKLNVSDKAISNWENGNNYPDIETISKLGKILEYDFYNEISETKFKRSKVKSILFYLLLFVFLPFLCFYYFIF